MHTRAQEGEAEAKKREEERKRGREAEAEAEQWPLRHLSDEGDVKPRCVIGAEDGGLALLGQVLEAGDHRGGAAAKEHV